MIIINNNSNDNDDLYTYLIVFGDILFQKTILVM